MKKYYVFKSLDLNSLYMTPGSMEDLACEIAAFVSQGAEAKKHVKNKMSGNMVDHSEGMPSVTPMKKKLSQAPESKKFVSNSKMTHSNKAKVVKESDLFFLFF